MRADDSDHLHLLAEQPDGNACGLETIERICTLFDGIVVVDEAYQDFSSAESATAAFRFERLVVLRTLSKCWGSPVPGWHRSLQRIISLITRMKYPYNVGGPSQALALEALSRTPRRVAEGGGPSSRRERMRRKRSSISRASSVSFPATQNFLLVRVTDAIPLPLPAGGVSSYATALPKALRGVPALHGGKSGGE